MLSLAESKNLELVKLIAQHGPTFPLFRGHRSVAQQSRVHLHSNPQHVEPTQAQCPTYPKIAMVLLHHFLLACSVLDHELFQYVVVAFFTACTPNLRSCFTTSFFCLSVLINRVAKSSRHVSMVAKKLDLNKSSMAAMSISALASFFADDPKSINRGENHYNSKHVESFEYADGVMRGNVHASMKNRTYKTTVN